MKLRLMTAVWILAFYVCLPVQNAFPQGNTKGIQWSSYDKGVAMSKEEGKKIFLYFWAEWCAYCTTMAKETFVDSSVIDYLNSHFISIKVDYDREKKSRLRIRNPRAPV
ncbi:MAG: DUF255 domain-containing protein, partial [Thermodesulfobacteriota bacterium]